MPRILIIDDEAQIRRLLRIALETRAYEISDAACGHAGIEAVAFWKPDVVILDLGLPDIDGLTVLQRIRAFSDAPVLVLSVRNREDVKVAALDAGADDFVNKPFGMNELAARLSALLRRRVQSGETSLSVGALEMDLLHREAAFGGTPLTLTPTEFAVLAELCARPGRLVTQATISSKVWPTQQSDCSEALRVHLTHLRKKLSIHDCRITNVPGVGYRIEIPTSADSPLS
jgi:two-component system, OmpR family, KDP operon response regulator KdpE